MEPPGIPGRFTIFLGGGSLKPQLERHDFPRLLLTTREVFKKSLSGEMAEWLSADSQVARSLANFDKQFSTQAQRELAAGVVSTILGFEPHQDRFKGEGNVLGPPKVFDRIRLKDFRNIRELDLDFGDKRVGTIVVHGPNGTGKTSVCEGISVALFQSSSRYRRFSDKSQESDVSVTDRAAEYLRKYLTPLYSDHSEPRVALDDAPLAAPSLAVGDRIHELDIAMSGTILTQDASLDFSRMPASELAIRVLRGYSELADRVGEFVETNARRADDQRQAFLRELGVSAAITKVATAYERISRREIERSLPRVPVALVEWLEIVDTVSGSSGLSLAERWRLWGRDESRVELARTISSADGASRNIIDAIQRWLETFNDLVSESSEVHASIASRVQGSGDALINHLNVWGEWLDARSRGPAAVLPEGGSALKQHMTSLEQELNSVVEMGRKATAHLEHLAAVETYIRHTWIKHEPSRCPTCETDHKHAGGILPVVESIRVRVTGERDEHRRVFRELKSVIEKAQKELAQLGEAQCPLSPLEQTTLSDAIKWLIPENVSIAEWITSRSRRDHIIRALTALKQVPSTPDRVEPEQLATRVAESLDRQFAEARKTFEAPSNWAPIKERLATTLTSIVSDHLPRTLEKLWFELAYNLTSAPWLLPQQPRLQLTLRRRERALSVRVKERLARYILNQAEAHTLGLAWFFSSYFTRGRFLQACMIMDEPAQELDQTSFRELCRLLETVVRLHRVYNRPLKLLLMFNQESRAVEAARATDATLCVLDWKETQDGSSVATRVIGEGFYASQPGTLFEAADVSEQH